MLGSQGPLDRQESDPNKVASFEPKPTPAMNYLLVLSAFVLGGLSLWLVSRPDVDFVARWVLLVGGAFFLWGGFIQARRAHKRRHVGFDATGLWIDGPRSRKVIRWGNIDQTSVWTVHSQQFNIIALKDVGDLVAQYTPEEAGEAVREESVLSTMAGALGISTGQSDLRGLEGMFAKRRNLYGGEIWIVGHDRDRDAAAFQRLVEAWRSKYVGEKTS